MERSSPLAAMRPPVIPGPWRGFGQPEYSSNFLAPYSHNGNIPKTNQNSVSSRDYFSCKPARESSPTSCLAIDLSQNFHIDRTPKLPTPRRSLFTTALMAKNLSNAFLTPPEPASSPSIDEHMLDVSPLPHKAPFQPSLAAVACSPTPEITPSVEEPMVIHPTMVRTQSNPDDINGTKQRKPLAPVRPFLRKGFSSANLNSRPKSAQNTSFQFGPPLPSISQTTLESFAESPPSATKTASIDPFMSSVSSSTLLFGSTATSTSDESPLNNPRKALCGIPPARGRYRRTQSMQCNNAERVTRQEKRICASGSFSISPPISVEDSYKLKLPHFRNIDDPDGLPRISKETCVDVIGGKYAADLGQYAIVDCRFEYEYQGGHIDGAVNYNDKEELARQLFDDKLMSQKAIIFHCEYSAHRAPIMAKFIRQRDRAVNQDNYPKLTYPEVYILDGGYSSFFQAHSILCMPQNYVEMSSVDHEVACEAGMAKVKRRNKLSRAQTYAFGQSSSTLQTAGLDMGVMRETVSAVEAPVGLGGRLPLMVLGKSSSNIDCMDIDFSSPFCASAISQGYNKRHGHIFGVGGARRLDSY